MTCLTMRLDRFICECTDLTRSTAKKALHRGDITINGQVVKNSGYHVSDSCDVRLLGQPLVHGGEHYIMLNKPADTVCSNVGEAGYASVLTLLDLPKADTLQIAGRLDADTTGLVLITSDGQWGHKVTSPRKACGKRYRVW
ncbi:pseudouridine synthase, partial [Sansalvadorimonas verongulae]|uniref:pseudouridine synthase n=1 Tax=Sansalvadorimonas verongulae TaxID=2172824 RepID=UPI002E353241